MKKLTALVLAIAMMLALGACVGNPMAEPEPEPVQEPEEEIEVPEPEPEPEVEEINAAVFWYDFKDAFLSTVREAMNSGLKDAGITFTNYDAENTQAIQNDQLDLALSNGADLLIVNIVDTAAVDAAQIICDKAQKADVPVIFFNREVDDTVINSYDQACFVGTRPEETGEMQGQMAGEYLAANFDSADLNGDGELSYIMMKGELGCGGTEARTYYSVLFCNTLLTEAGRPELKFYDENNTDEFLPANWSRQTAFELMETALSANPMDGDAPIEVAFANNDDEAIGVIDALNNAGWNKGDPEKTIPVFGIDFTSDARAAIKAGKMAGSVLQSAVGMAETVTALAKNVQEGRNVFDGAEEVFNVDDAANKIRVPYEIKTKENA